MNNAIYLRVTMHDNDFTGSLKHVANVLYEIFQDENRFPEEDEIPLIQKYIKGLWFSIHNISTPIYYHTRLQGMISMSGTLSLHKKRSGY